MNKNRYTDLAVENLSLISMDKIIREVHLFLTNPDVEYKTRKYFAVRLLSDLENINSKTKKIQLYNENLYMNMYEYHQIKSYLVDYVPMLIEYASITKGTYEEIVAYFETALSELGDTTLIGYFNSATKKKGVMRAVISLGGFSFKNKWDTPTQGCIKICKSDPSFILLDLQNRIEMAKKQLERIGITNGFKHIKIKQESLSSIDQLC